VRYARERVLHADKADGTASWWPFTPPDARNRLDAIDVQVLISVGELDASINSPIMTGISGCTPGAVYQALPGNPHMRTPELLAGALDHVLPAERTEAR